MTAEELCQPEAKAAKRISPFPGKVVSLPAARPSFGRKLSEFPADSAEGSVDPLGMYIISRRLGGRIAPGAPERQVKVRLLTAIVVSPRLRSLIGQCPVAADGVTEHPQVFEWAWSNDWYGGATPISLASAVGTVCSVYSHLTICYAQGAVGLGGGLRAVSEAQAHYVSLFQAIQIPVPPDKARFTVPFSAEPSRRSGRSSAAASSVSPTTRSLPHIGLPRGDRSGRQFLLVWD